MRFLKEAVLISSLVAFAGHENVTCVGMVKKDGSVSVEQQVARVIDDRYDLWYVYFEDEQAYPRAQRVLGNDCLYVGAQDRYGGDEIEQVEDDGGSR